MWEAERWVAFYSETEVYRSEDWTWQALPASGMLVVVLINPTGRTIMAGGDWYFMHEGKYGYVSSKEWGKDEPRPDIACQSCVKYGVGAPDDVFQRIYDIAFEKTF